MIFTFVNSTVMVNILRKSIKLKSPSLQGSRIVGDAFSKSLSID